RRMLVGEKVRLTNRITAALKSYYPQVLEWLEDKDTQVFCEFLTRYPTLKTAQAAPKEELEQFFKSNHVVQAKTINRRIEQIEQGVVLTEDVGIVEPLQLLVKALIAQLQVLLTSIASFDAKIADLFAAHPDAPLFAALPGAGPHLAPRLLVAFGEERVRYSTAQDLLRYSGIAPIKESRGQKSGVHWQASPEGGFPYRRETGAVELSQVFEADVCGMGTAKPSLLVLGRGVLPDATEKRETHQADIRALAFKWIRIVFRCWQDRVPYDEVKYLMALQRKNSPLLQDLTLTKAEK
ncbi:IS110 family transposase, partial [bacterium]|nr:IS110 family transposase [bacterium]